MKPATAKIAHGLIFGIAVTLTGATAQAGLYEHIDDHSHDIEQEAERADAIVKYNFRHAPPSIVQYLREGLAGVARSAHELHELTKCSGNVLAIDAMTSQLDAQFHEVEEGVLVLREWVTGSNCSVRRFSSCFTSCKPRSVDRANLTSLDRRIRDIDEELHDMRRDLQKVLATFHRNRHSSHGHTSSFSRAPAPVVSHSRFESTPRQIIPLGTYERPGHNFSRSSSFSRGNTVSRDHGSSHGSSSFSFGNRGSRHSRHSDSSYIHTRIGGFGLSFRLR
ncbi:MAG: hypothetical protein ACKVHE_15145 [Planctomycetales bacterium]|jgi:hypothetical protein